MSKRRIDQNELNHIVKRQKTFDPVNHQDQDQVQNNELMNIQSCEMDCEQTIVLESPFFDLEEVQIDESDINVQPSVNNNNNNNNNNRCPYTLTYATHPKNLMNPFSCKYCYHGISCFCEICRFYMI